jgi:uncharacterized protein YueI
VGGGHVLDRDKVEEYLQTGMYGPKEIKPEERKRFLGTLRERIVVALTQQQVRGRTVMTELERVMKENSKAHLYLNGQIEYAVLSNYIKIANKISIPFTIVNNQEVETDIGLVLAYDYAVEKEEIFLKDKPQLSNNKNQEIGFLKKLKKLF